MKHTSERACEWIRPKLSAYADGELNKRQAAAVRGHLCSCSACARELEELNALNERLSEASDGAELSPRVHASVMNAIGQMPRSKQQTRATSTVWLRRVGGALAGVGCFIVIAAAVTMGGVGNKSFDAMAPESADAPNSSVADAAGKGPYYDADESYDMLPEEPLGGGPAAPEVECPPSDALPSTYELQRVSGEGEAIDGVWTCDMLRLSVNTEQQVIKLWFAYESSREGSCELTGTELIVRFEDGEMLTFDWKLEEDTLWLTRKE